MTPSETDSAQVRNTAVSEWLPIFGGLVLLYFFPFYSLATGLWREEDYAHGPVILAVVVWLIWDKREVFLSRAREIRPKTGLAILAFGLAMYVLGQSQDITFVAVGSLIPVFAGTLLALRGKSGLQALWFALVFTIYLVPLPSAFVDSITGSLKQDISQIAEIILYHAGFPVARSGVTLTIGPYQLLVADACSGINSMFSLSAVGLLYLYLVQRPSWIHNLVVLASIFPIAFGANIVRVILIILITYKFGDAAGQGFIHGFAGMVLFVVALISVFLIDWALTGVAKLKRQF